MDIKKFLEIKTVNFASFVQFFEAAFYSKTYISENDIAAKNLNCHYKTDKKQLYIEVKIDLFSSIDLICCTCKDGLRLFLLEDVSVWYCYNLSDVLKLV